MNKNIILLVIGLLTINVESRCRNKSTAESDIIQATQQRGMIDKRKDMELEKILSQTVDKFVQQEYVDTKTGKSITYNLFIPEGYNKNKQYPLVLFMADASTVNKDTKTPLNQGYGGVIWALEEDQTKHPSFVLVPEYKTQTANDQFERSYEVDTTIDLLNSVMNTYNINKDQLYTTGQSMGGMMSMYFNIADPNLFAASIFVGCQWDTSKMDSFTQNKFCYIVAAGDEKAPKGMAQLEKVLKENGAKIGTAEWSAKLPLEEQEADVTKLLSEGYHINFITFSLGSVLPEDGTGNEHMYSFDYAYKLEGIRDWLFRQKK